MSKNAAFYGGSVALSEVGIDQKYQLTFMAAVTVVGHGKTAKAGYDAHHVIEIHSEENMSGGIYIQQSFLMNINQEYMELVLQQMNYLKEAISSEI